MADGVLARGAADLRDRVDAGAAITPDGGLETPGRAMAGAAGPVAGELRLAAAARSGRDPGRNADPGHRVQLPARAVVAAAQPVGKTQEVGYCLPCWGHGQAALTLRGIWRVLP